MPTPDARPAGETLSETVLWTVRRREELEDAMAAAAEHLASGVTGRVDVAWTALSLALDAYRDSVAAEARAALLAGAPEVWVATDAGHYVSFLHLRKPEEWSGQFAVTHHRSMRLDAQITPPGTCVRYRLVPDPEEAP